MPRAKCRIVKANGSIVFETQLNKEMRFTIPEVIRGLLTPKEWVRITIERTPEVKK